MSKLFCEYSENDVEFDENDEISELISYMFGMFDFNKNGNFVLDHEKCSNTFSQERFKYLHDKYLDFIYGHETAEELRNNSRKLNKLHLTLNLIG